MSNSPLSLAFVMDPLGSIDIQADTTFVLMLEAQQRGHEILYVAPSDIGVDGGLPVARVTPVKLRRSRTSSTTQQPASAPRSGTRLLLTR